jgi:hypothetical protein
MISRRVQVGMLAMLVVVIVAAEGVLLGASVAFAIIGAYRLGAESGESPPSPDDLKEWST